VQCSWGKLSRRGPLIFIFLIVKASPPLSIVDGEIRVYLGKSWTWVVVDASGYGFVCVDSKRESRDRRKEATLFLA
jgi:hypothetical protein